MVTALESLNFNRVLAESFELSFFGFGPLFFWLLRLAWILSDGRRELVAKSQYTPWTTTDARTTFNSSFFTS